MSDNTSGKRWARFALIFGASMSVLGNETHTFLTDGTVNLPIRIVLALIWPTAVFVAVEVLVRVQWRTSDLDYIGRAVMLLPVGLVAVVVSYQHLHALMGLAGEDAFSAMIGPVGIDGLMIGGTVALLSIRAREMSPKEEVVSLSPEEFEEKYATEDWDRAKEEGLGAEMMQEISQPEPSSSKALELSPPRVSSPRSSFDVRKVAEMILDGEKDGPIAEATGASRTTIGRLRKVTKLLQADPRVSVDSEKEKVSPANVSILRELVTR